ncbi:aconitase family protein [Paraburkholderia xenovorans]|uniref:aconitase family protein n=1 Tax=Paraburkholderia xenovorans TaxID=36873 RepID=UPI002277161D|nr:aconitase family protein [Paraburkholderia xenovorans]
MSDIGEDVALGRVIELVGPSVEQLSISGRMTLCNWTRKVQAVTGILNPDEKTLTYVSSRTTEPLDPLFSDAEAAHEAERDYDVSTLEPVVAAPPDPLNVVSLPSLAGLRIDQAFVGSCAGAVWRTSASQPRHCGGGSSTNASG